MSRRLLVIVTGPMSSANLGREPWPIEPVELVDVGCIGSDKCAAIAAALPAGRKLEALLASRGKLLAPEDMVEVVSFSAGHGLVNALLTDPPSRDRINAVVALDSYYTGQPAVKEGYLAYAKRAQAGQAAMLLTLSTWPDLGGKCSSSKCAEPFIRALGAKPFKAIGASGFQAPERAWESGDLVVLDYGQRYKHGEHATALGPKLARGVAARLASEHASSTSSAIVIGLTVAAALATAGVLLARRRP